jgi:hypothetical protein
MIFSSARSEGGSSGESRCTPPGGGLQGALPLGFQPQAASGPAGIASEDQSILSIEISSSCAAGGISCYDAPGGAMRSMSNPTLYNDPDRMGSPLYYCLTNDNGGVHTNSGVGNKAASLLVDGGTFNGYTVAAIGLDKTARIWYEVQTQMLTSGSDYQDLHDALAQACNNLVGTAGITTYDCGQVREAISAAEMNRQPPSCAANHAPLCDEYGFDSQFNSSAASWYGSAGTWYIGANYLYTYGAPSVAYSAVTYQSFGDLDYSVSMRRYGCSYCSSGVMIRGTPTPLANANWWNSGYGFFYIADGSLSVWRFQDGGYVPLLGWTGSEAINVGDAWNTLRVVAEGPSLAFYINGDLVWSGIDSELSFGRVGLIMYRDSYSTDNLLQVDWATLAGGTPLNLFYDALESGPGNWYSSASIGADEWYYETGYATSGNHMLYGWDQPSVADYDVRMVPDVALPAGKTAYLHFNHAHEFEAVYDGGVVEYSVDGGPWTDAAPLFTHNGYNGTLSADYSNPLGGRSAFVDASHGYYSSRLDLGSLAGHSVRFRYRIGTDSSVSHLGWLIDDVRIYTCARQATRLYLPLVVRDYTPPPSVPGFDSQFNNSAAGWEVHSGAWTVGSDYYSTPGLMNLSSSVSYAQEFADLDYQVRMRRSGCTGCANRVIIRGTPEPLVSGNHWYSFYSFQYTADGHYSIWKIVEGGSSTALQGSVFSPAIITGNAWNTLRVVANGSSLSFYVNGTLLWSGTDTSLESGRVGIGMAQDASAGNLLEVDWATLSVPDTTARSGSGGIVVAPGADGGGSGDEDGAFQR